MYSKLPIFQANTEPCFNCSWPFLLGLFILEFFFHSPMCEAVRKTQKARKAQKAQNSQLLASVDRFE